MSTDSAIWHTLAIEPTSDVAEIRRAYAAKLKTTNPEDDAEAFKTLRAAYELALQWVRGGGGAPATQPVPAAATQVPPTSEPEIRREEYEPAAEDPLDAEVRELQKAFEALHAALAKQDGDSDPNAVQALAAFLRSPALENVNVAREAEFHLANLLASTIPSSDALLPDAARRFGWLAADLKATPAVDAVVARLSDLAFLETLGTRRSPYAKAFRGLQRRKIPLWSWLRAHIIKSGEVGEYQLLQIIRAQHPSLTPLLNAGAVAWWDRVASRPQISVVLLLLGLAIGGPLLLIGWRNDRTFAPGIWAFGIAVGLALWKLYLVDWPRLWMRERWSIEPPAWFASGWLPGALLGLAGAVVAPQQRALTLLAAVVAVVAVQWALWVRAPRPQPSSAGTDAPLKLFVPPMALAFWWAGSFGQFPPGTVGPMLIPSFALTLAGALGAETLRTLWMRKVTLSQRRGITAMLILLSVATASLLWWLTPEEQWRPACMALVLAVVVLHGPLTLALSERQQKVRLALVVIVVLGLIVASVLEAASPAFRARGPVLVGGGLIWLATSTFGTVLAGRNDLRASHVR